MSDPEQREPQAGPVARGAVAQGTLNPLHTQATIPEPSEHTPTTANYWLTGLTDCINDEETCW